MYARYCFFRFLKNCNSENIHLFRATNEPKRQSCGAPDYLNFHLYHDGEFTTKTALPKSTTAFITLRMKSISSIIVNNYFYKNHVIAN
jgi:hypothetical protein